jgi:hypothetical protein
MNDTKKTNHTMEYIALNQCAPADYQRNTNDRQVSAIVKKFDEAKLGSLTVSLRDGKYYIIDGLHRSKALKALNYTHAPCIVLRGLTYEQEAAYFRNQNQDRRGITKFDDYKAGLEAKDEVCLKIDEILRANEFQVGKGGFYKIAAVKALFTIVKEYGYKTLDDTLCLLASTWSNVDRASSSEFLLGVAEFVHRYGVAEFSERMKDKFAVVVYEYTEAMRICGAIGSYFSRKRFCAILVDNYNKGLKRNYKKYLKWED